MVYDYGDPYGVSYALAFLSDALIYGSVVAVLLFFVRGRG